MKKTLFFSIAIMMAYLSFGQKTEAIYLDKKWQPTKESKARIIREVTKINDTLFKVSEFDSDRNILMTGEYSSIVPMIENGYFEFFDNESKSISVKGQYKAGLMVGDWLYNDSKTVNYDFISDCDIDTSDVNMIVEIMPKFQGKDMNAYREYIANNLVYPPRSVMQAISGRIFVEFTINKVGEVCNPKIVRGVNNDLDREALRVIAQSPSWTPALQRGEPVNVQFTFPIIFILQ